MMSKIYLNVKNSFEFRKDYKVIQVRGTSEAYIRKYLADYGENDLEPNHEDMSVRSSL